MKEMIVGDLFCGAGGFSLGFEKAGCKVAFALDQWKGCQGTFEYNHPNTEFILSDIKEQDPHDYKKKKVKILIGSPPCQNFSNANNNPDPKKGLVLVREYFRWVEILEPEYWIMENVPGLEKYLKQRIKFKIPKISIYNAADYGVPQKRRRCFAGKYITPKITHSKSEGIDLFGNEIKKWLTVWDAIKDIIFIEPNQQSIPNHACFNFNEEKNNPKYIGKWQGQKKIDLLKPSYTITDNHGNTNLIPNHVCFDNCRDINHEQSNRIVNLDKPSAVIRPDNRSSKKLCLSDQRSPLKAKAHSPFYSSDNPARTITNTPYAILKNKITEYRRLTVRECARLQSFPDDFIFFGSKTTQYKMVGNAVSPLMSHALALAIKNQVNKIDKNMGFEREITVSHQNNKKIDKNEVNT